MVSILGRLGSASHLGVLVVDAARAFKNLQEIDTIQT